MVVFQGPWGTAARSLARPRDIVIMDNLPAHKVHGVRPGDRGRWREACHTCRLTVPTSIPSKWPSQSSRPRCAPAEAQTVSPTSGKPSPRPFAASTPQECANYPRRRRIRCNLSGKCYSHFASKRPIWLGEANKLEPRCRRQSSTHCQDHGAACRRRSRPRLRQADRRPVAATSRLERADNSCQSASASPAIPLRPSASSSSR